MKSILDHPEIIQRVAESLFRNIDKYDDLLYRQFFLNRIEDVEFLLSRLTEVQAYGGNVLVVGEPGVGKSSFLNWFLKSEAFSQSCPADACTVLDLTTTPYVDGSHDPFIAQLKGKLAKSMAKHLHRLGDPCHDLPIEASTPDSWEAQYNYCADKLSNLSQAHDIQKTEIHYVFLDDVDYLPGSCFTEILEYLKPILFSRYFCVIIACRTPAHNLLKSHRDYNVSRAFDDSTVLYLDPLPVHAILRARIQALTQQGRTVRALVQSDLSKTTLKTLIDFLAGFIGRLSAQEDLELFDYPFTEKQHAFMRMMTNGNARYVLLMAQEYLNYMCTNPKLIKRERQGYWVGRPAVIQHFTQDSINAHIRIHDLHVKKTLAYATPHALKKKGISQVRVGNSVYVVLLETYKAFQYPNRIDQQYLESLDNEYGLTRDQIRDGTVELIELGLVRERVLYARPALGSRSLPREFELTDKGDCYLNYLIHWDEYIAKFGVSNHHRRFRTIETKHSVQAALMEFVINIAAGYERAAKRRSTGVLRIPKGTFHAQFCKTYRDLFRLLDPTDKLTDHRPTIEEISDYLTQWLQVVKPKGLASEFYDLQVGSIKGEADRRGLPFELKAVYDVPAFEKFIRTFARDLGAK